MAKLIHHRGINDNPEALLEGYLRDDSELLLLVGFAFECYWLQHRPKDMLNAVYGASDGSLWLAVSEQEIVLPGNMEALSVADAFAAICQKNRLTAFDLDRPMGLGRVQIEKPWGREIWYTGIEPRGVCSAQGNTGANVDNIQLPWLLAAAPKRLTAGLHRQLILLKILDPFPEEVLGDLYFELHEEKREVYVVTHVDRRAWPDGKGAIRMGFNQAMRARFDSDEAFRQAYLEAVSSYRLIRDEIDVVNDGNKIAKGLDASVPVSGELYAELALMIPSDLIAAEKVARQRMDEFTCLNPLTVGDVVKVPTYTPHALQHGVRTVEFQTPVYERMILSFGQKVLTQSHWDTERAVESMKLDVEGAFNDLEQDSSADGVISELVVEFEDFRVMRVSCQPGSSFSLVARQSYQILMVVQGQLKLSGLEIGPEHACLVPAAYPGGELINDNAQAMIFLLAQPLLGH